MNELIQIICPVCGSILAVKNIPNIDSNNVICPICKHRDKVDRFKEVNEETDGWNK